ncbi:MAG: Hsp70 family protein [Bacteroidia bacterium]|nr:Hsp70 family protein [Bacteroidia bacterium]
MTINFGIDLGTTNSAIAKYEQGKVIIFRNPIGQKQTLPSVVGTRKGRRLVGEKAREYLMQAPDQVAASFKRKMGTSENFKVGDEVLSPVELSSFVLKELKNFVHSGEQVEAAIITIPASFDTIQSNATKEAGYMAGFDQVVLLQEPIAASLAYANQDDKSDFQDGKWLVYDLGGGTFDVALVSIQDGEMRVIDHEGDNFLGGNDFDRQIVEAFVLPYLESQGTFNNLLDQSRASDGKYNQLYQSLLLKAENAKIELSVEPSAEIEFETRDDAGEMIEGFITITREQFDSMLQPFVGKTVEMIAQMLERNKLKPNELNFVLMVGGSTYIPYVREKVGEALQIEVNTEVDPTTAVAAGAAYYAGTKSLKRNAESASETVKEDESTPKVKVKMAFQKATQEEKEYFAARFEGELSGLSYRITRLDGGFDSGLKPLSAKISEFLPLLKDAYNEFELKIYDHHNNQVQFAIDPIGITQGKYAVVGQPLPQDICMEIDDVENETTVLEVVFEKNAILPLRKTIVKQMSRTIAKGSEERLTISIVEGPNTALPAATQPIGFISISGKDLTRDLVRGSDVEVTLDISESRDLKIAAYLMMTDQEFEDVFTPSVRKVNVFRLRDELLALAEKVRKEIADQESQGNYEGAQNLVDLEYDILALVDRSKKLQENDSTDEKFQIEDVKRKLAQKVDELTRDKFIIAVKNEYFEAKRDIEFVIEHYEAPQSEIDKYNKLLEEEKVILATNSSLRIKDFIGQVRRLNFQIRWKNSRYIKDLFAGLSYGRFGPFTDPNRANNLIEEGNRAIADENYDQLRVVINQLFDLLPPVKRKDIHLGGTGIS